MIPFGEIEGVGLSDPSTLQETFGWSTRELVDRHVMVGVLCGAMILGVWLYSTWRMYKRERS